MMVSAHTPSSWSPSTRSHSSRLLSTSDQEVLSLSSVSQPMHTSVHQSSSPCSRWSESRPHTSVTDKTPLKHSTSSHEASSTLHSRQSTSRIFQMFTRRCTRDRSQDDMCSRCQTQNRRLAHVDTHFEQDSRIDHIKKNSSLNSV